MITQQDMVNNILAAYANADEDHVRLGRAWYGQAHETARDLADHYGVTWEVAAGVIAALSPRTSWRLNILNAHVFLGVGHAPTLGRSNTNAALIVKGEDLDVVLRGRKTRAFAANILLDTDAVTVDRHALRIAGVDRDSVTPRQYDTIADAYREAARIAHETPAAMQAITWVARRDSAE